MSLWTRIYEERRRIILPLLIAAVVNLAVLLLAVVPLRRSVTTTEAAAHDATLSLASANQQLRQAREAASSRQRADTELQRFYTSVLPENFAVAARTTNRWLQQTAQQEGLEYRGASFSWDEVRESSLSRAYSQATLRGRYADIRRFLHAVEAADEFLVVERLELDQASAGTGSGSLEVSLLVSTFFVTEPARQ